VRERRGIDKSPEAFSEFRWAEFFRRRVRIDAGPGGFEWAIEDALVVCHPPEVRELPDYIALPRVRWNRPGSQTIAQDKDGSTVLPLIADSTEPSPP